MPSSAFVNGQSPDGNGAAQRIVGTGQPLIKHLFIRVNGAGTVFIGDSAVTSATGVPLVVADGWVHFKDINHVDELYFNVAAGTKVAWIGWSP